MPGPSWLSTSYSGYVKEDLPPTNCEALGKSLSHCMGFFPAPPSLPLSHLMPACLTDVALANDVKAAVQVFDLEEESWMLIPYHTPLPTPAPTTALWSKAKAGRGA